MKSLSAPCVLVPVLVAACATQAPEPELFAPGTVSTEGREFATTFSTDGETVYFNTVEEGKIYIRAASHVEGGWGPHEALAFSDGSSNDVDPFVTRDGLAIVFSSNRPLPGTESTDFNLWFVRRPDRDGGEWSTPEPLGSPPNGPEDEIFATLTDEGTVYFSARAGDAPRQIYRCVLDNGRYGPRERVDLGLGPEVHVGNPLIAPDESFLVFTSEALGGQGAVDLILCQRREDGSWSEPAPLPAPVNSAYADFAPGLGPDGRTLYFTSERPGMVGADKVQGRPPGDLYAVSLEPYLP